MAVCFRILLISLVVLPVISFSSLRELFHLNDADNKVMSNKISAPDSRHHLDPEAKLDFCGIANYHGYGCEQYNHEVETKDGFLLTLHRVTGRMRAKATNRGKPPVFVQHGLLGDSTMWVLNPPNETLPFQLSDAGYDVWMGNSRGNTYSKAHKTLSPDQTEFWAWSWDEMAQFDLPASIDFVLEKTGYEKLHYIGHSQGTLIAFVHLATSNTTKILHMIAAAPVFNVHNMLSPIRIMSPFANDLAMVLKLFGLKDFLPNNSIIKWIADVICPDFLKIFPLCSDTLTLLSGYDSKQLNVTRIPVYIHHTPAGTSVQNMIHFAQMVNSKKCSRFDYGTSEANRKHYGQPTPPAYDISPINTPVSLMWGQNDWLADPKDVQYIRRNVNTIKNDIYIPEWNHMDFVWAVDSKSVMIDPILEMLRADFLPEQ